MTQKYEHPAITFLKEKAREYGIPEHEALKAWEEMKAKYRLPPYVEPRLEIKYGSNSTVALQPAVDIMLLSRLDKEVPNWESISGPAWVKGGMKWHSQEKK